MRLVFFYNNDNNGIKKNGDNIAMQIVISRYFCSANVIMLKASADSSW